MFFEGFGLRHVEVGGGALRVRVGGSGPPLLLLHGNPQAHAMWHRVAPALTRTHTVVCPNLRGYGGSFRPAPSGDHAAYSKRAISGDMLTLMDAPGFATFAVASHDQGARVAHRLALDVPERVERLAVLDIVPIPEQFERGHGIRAGVLSLVLVRAAAPQAGLGDQCGAGRVVHRAHLARPRPGRHGAGFLRARGEGGLPGGGARPRMCGDDRAVASIDLAHDRASRLDGARVRCPMLVLWGAKGRIGG